jgi:peptide/nickel transport system substrate-binding protein
VLVVAALIAGACSSSKSSGNTKANTSSGGSSSGSVKQGGDLVVAADQEPDCMDWIGSCAGSSWGAWIADVETMPHAYVYTNSGYQAGDILTGEATVVTSPKQVVTYHIKPQAVWSDGQPITSTDFKYTWDQIAHGKDIYDQTGYSQVASVDTPDPKTAVVTFSSPYPDWKALFGAFYGVFPSHILANTDRDTAMKDGYNWSGGPWKIDHWTKTVELKLVPNPSYWGKKPNLSSITYRFITDTSATQQDLKSGQVSVSYPQAQPGLESLNGVNGLKLDTQAGLNYEALWFNVEKAPLDSAPVRQALAYATDRNAIVNQLFAPIEPGIKPIQSIYTPAFGNVYTTPFSKYSLDLAKVTSLMQGAGWTKGSDGIWEKGGQKANLELKTTTGNQRRLLTAQILQSQWKAAGFGLTLTPEKSSVLFGKDLPAGNFQIGLYAQTPTDNDPGQCVIWCSKNIPGPSNGNNGENFDRYSNPTVDQLYTDVDTNLDQAKRISESQQAQAQLSNDVPAIPLDPFPDIIVVNANKVGFQGLSTFLHNFSYGPFFYANYWYSK